MKNWPEEAIQCIQQLKREIKELKEENRQLKQLVKELQSRLEDLENKASGYSFVKPDKKKRGKKLGGKPGHKGYGRPLPDHVDGEVDLSFDHCPDCGEKLSDTQDTF